MPTINKPKRPPWFYDVDTSQHGRRKNPNQKIYNCKKWRQIRRNYIQLHPLCEVSKELMPAFVVDHVISINSGGAIYDERNFMAMSGSMHDRKSAMESKIPILVDYILNENGEKIPKDKKQIIEVLIQ